MNRSKLLSEDKLSNASSALRQVVRTHDQIVPAENLIDTDH